MEEKVVVFNKLREAMRIILPENKLITIIQKVDAQLPKEKGI